MSEGLWRDDLCIVAADNRSWGDSNTVVELWCRSQRGHSVLLLVNGLRPYIEISPREGGCSGTDEDIRNVLSLSSVTEICPPVTKWSSKGDMPHWRVMARDTTVITRLREVLKADWTVTSADIQFHKRLLYDLDLGPHITAKGRILSTGPRAPSIPRDIIPNEDEALERILSVGGRGIYPVDVVMSVDAGDLEACEPFQTPFVTMSIDLETSIATNRILCAAVVVERNGKRSEFTYRGDEVEDILIPICDLVRDQDPDIITGYNIDNFDLPRILERTEALVKKDRRVKLFGWGRVPPQENSRRVIPSRGQNRTWNISGRVPMDAWWQARQTLKPERESLRFVTALIWPDNDEMKKLDIDASRMDHEWKTRPDEVVKYCLRDTHLPIDILNHLQSIQQKEALAAVARTSFSTAATETTSQWIDSLVIRLADRENVAVPMTRQGRRGEQIAGGYVHEVEPGLRSWIAVLDFKSMYPSIMITNNICPTTLVEGDDKMSDDSVSPTTGTRYRSQTHRNGLVPRLLTDLMTLRDEYKKTSRVARADGDEQNAFLNDRLQFAVKILMNSFYGVFASSFYRFTHKDIGASITEWARHNIKSIISDLNADGYDVVYSDTDSIFVRTRGIGDAPINKPEDDENKLRTWEQAKEETINFGRRLANKYSKEGAELEFETAMSAFFSHGAKKRYVGRVVWPREEMLIRGYEVRRTDSFKLLTATMTMLFEKILQGKEEFAVDRTRKVIEDVRRGNVAVGDLVISRSCKGKIKKDGSVDFSVYSNPDGLPYVRAAKQRIARGLGFTPGMKVGYVVSNAKSSPMEVSAWLTDELGDEPPSYDPEYYARRLATALGRITEAFSWNEKDLLQGSRQQSLFDY